MITMTNSTIQDLMLAADSRGFLLHLDLNGQWRARGNLACISGQFPHNDIDAEEWADLVMPMVHRPDNGAWLNIQLELADKIQIDPL